MSINRGKADNRSLAFTLESCFPRSRKGLRRQSGAQTVGQYHWLNQVLAVVLSLSFPMASFAAGPTSSSTHRLMPGLRSTDLRDGDWPRTMHDKLATGFSPLNCAMAQAPTVWSEVSVPGQFGSLQVLSRPGEDDRLLVSEAKLRMFSAAGDQLWAQPAAGALVCHARMTGTAQEYLLLTYGPTLEMRDASTGEKVWSHSFQPKFTTLRIRVADVLPEVPGLEAVVFLNYGEEGALLNFPPDGEPHVIWQKPVVTHGEFDERYDHVCQIELDLSEPRNPVIWNVRRYRCRGFDARTGEIISSVEYSIGGEHRRNYGPAGLGRARNGDAIALVVAENVQLHVHAIRLHRHENNELAWQHFYGESYRDSPGVAMEELGFCDIDHDGASDVCYSVRDPARGYRSFVCVRDGETGEVKCELPDYWAVALLQATAPGGQSALLAYAAPDGAMPTQGNLELYLVGRGCRFEKGQSFPSASLLSFTKEEADGDREPFVLRAKDAARAGADGSVTSKDALQEFALIERQDNGSSVVNDYVIEAGKVHRTASFPGSGDTNRKPLAILHDANRAVATMVAAEDGQLLFLNRDGAASQKHRLDGASNTLLAAADLDNDGRAELISATADGSLRVDRFDDAGHASRVAEYPYVTHWPERGPVAYDLLGDKTMELITLGSTADGRLEVSAQPLNRPPLWRCVLEVNAEDVQGCTINAGQFLAADHSAVAVSFTDGRLVHEGTYLLDGRTGAACWTKSHYEDFGSVMPFRAKGIPTAYDFDGDGVEEIGMDLLSYMAYIHGTDGNFTFIRPTHNVSMDKGIANGHLYNTFCPVYFEEADQKPHWMVIGGFGPFGMMESDPMGKLWNVDLGYDGPPNVAMIDVDGDGVLEVGYCASNDKKFICRDIWTGKTEWTLDLPYAPNSSTIVADVDGDGKGEFLTGPFCIGTDKNGQGQLRWQAPASVGSGLIADFDGDGRGEIACQSGDRLLVLKGRAAKSQ
jgi:hypothetical protein